MRDDGPPFIKMPPAAFYHAETRRGRVVRVVTGNHLRVLAVLSQYRDFQTDIVDLGHGQVGRALLMDRREVQKLVADLVGWGYLKDLDRQTSHHTNHYRLDFSNDPRDRMPAGQDPHPCGSGPAFPAGQAPHSSDYPENKQTNRRAQAREADGSCEPGQYWTLPLEATDLNASTPLVVEGRNLGFTRTNGRDGLQEEYGHFLRHRKKRNYRKPAKRSEFREWLRKATPARSDLTGTAEKSATITAPAKPADDDLEIPSFLKREAPPPPPKWQLRIVNGAAPWRRGVLKALEAVETAHGATAADYVAQCLIENHGGVAVLRAKMPDHARLITDRYLPTFSAAWVDALGETDIRVLSAKEKLDA